MRIKWFSFIRILGLLLVLVYHFFKDSLPGGFIGVDVFFTFSGYLITAILIDEFFKTEKIDFENYLRRRFYRIFPPLVLTIVTCLPFALLLRRDYLAGIGRQISSAIGFVTNFYEMSLGSNYEAQFAPHLLLHTWSLAIEVQYYLIWGLILWLMSKRVTNRRHYRLNVFLLAINLALFSLLMMFVGLWLKTDLSNLYFSPFSHSFPMFLGSALGALVGVREVSHFFKKWRETWPVKWNLIGAGLSAFFLLGLGLTLNFENKLTYQIGFLLASLLACLLILFARLLSAQLPQEEPKWATFLANISYGIYLFHWPVYIISKELMPHLLAVTVTVLVSTAMAALSFYIIEPLLMGHQVASIKQLPPQKQLFYGTAALGLLLIGFMAKVVTSAPNVGPFETNMMLKGLQQSANGLQTTRQLIDGKAQALTERPNDNLDNVMVIGDSVALDAIETYPERLKEAIVDVRESRSFAEAYDIYLNHIDNGSLSQFVVLAVGVNSLYNYQEDLQGFIDNLPDDHHLILVTPYTEDEYADLAREARDYELDLADQYERVSVIDWYQIGQDNPDLWVGSDGYHFSHTTDTLIKGATLYIDAILSSLNLSSDTGEGESLQVLESALIIGDSVMIDAGDEMRQAFPNSIVDYQANRNLADVNDVLSNYLANGNTPEMIVVAAGVNEISNYKEELKRLVDLVPDGSRLVLMTPYNGHYSGYDSSTVSGTRAYELKLAKRHDFVTVADWVKTAENHPEIWENTDLVHMSRQEGYYEDYELLAQAAEYYTQTLVQAVHRSLKAPTK